MDIIIWVNTLLLKHFKQYMGQSVLKALIEKLIDVIEMPQHA